MLELPAKLASSLVDQLVGVSDPGVTFGHRGDELCQRIGVLARDAIERLLKFPTRFLEAVLGLGKLRREAATFAFRGGPSSLEGIAVVLVLDLATSRLFAE